jgi:hypothetical protein
VVQLLLNAPQAYFVPGYPVISATREKNAFLIQALIVQFTGTVWNPFNASNGPVLHLGRGW